MSVVTQSEFARMQGWAKSYVTALKIAGRLVMTPEGLVDVEASRERIKSTADPEREAVGQRWDEYRARSEDAPPQAQPADKIGNSYQAARAVKEKFAAMTAKMEYERATGKLLEAADVASALADAGATFRATMSNLPAIVSPMLASLGDETQIRLVLEEKIEQALTELSQALKGLGSGRREEGGAA